MNNYAKSRVDSESVYDYLIKIVVIGDSNVGKTSILQRFTDQNFTESQMHTIGVDFKVRTLQVSGKRVKIQIWDTAGQEKFRVLTKAYYRKASGIVVVYDVTDGRSFVNTKRWIEEAKENCENENIPVVLVGNKCESENRIISLEDLKEYASLSNVKYFESSAKENINIDEIFIQLTEMILNAKHGIDNIKVGVKLNPSRSEKKHKCC